MTEDPMFWIGYTMGAGIVLITIAFNAFLVWYLGRLTKAQ